MREPEEEVEDLENLEENDEIIGVMLRRSLLVAVLVAALAAVGYGAWRFLDREKLTDSEIAVSGPVAVADEEVVIPEIPFRNVTEEAGIDFVHVNGATGDRFLPETMGGGVAFLDADADGDQDLILINSSTWDGSNRATSRYYENDGAGRFRDRTEGSGLDFVAYATSVAVGDIDNDGFPDLFVGAVGPNRLVRNVERGGRRVFEDVTERSGVAGEPDRWSSSSAFFDVDNDGDLDLFVGNYVEWSRQIDLDLDYRLVGVGRAYGQPVNYAGTFSYLYRNRGDGTFDDVSEEAGVQVRNGATGEPVGKALGLAPVDADGDGLMDLVVANDTVRNFFFQNLGGTFEEMGEIVGLAYGRQGEATGAMGIDAAFYRNDGDLSLVIGNFANEMSSFYVAQGTAALFADESITVGLGAPSRRVLTFGTFFFDADLDGWMDILQVNGHLENEISKVEDSQTYEQSPQLFWNAGDAVRQPFLAVEQIGDLAEPIVGRGSAYADIDADGDQDVLLLQTGGPARLLRNDQTSGNGFLRVRLAGDGAQSNRDAIGAWVTLRTSAGTQRRQVMPTKGYQSQSELPVTFGLAEGIEIEELTVHWPGTPRDEAGQNVALDRIPANGELLVTQGSSN